jgi:hypothetical protein
MESREVGERSAGLHASAFVCVSVEKDTCIIDFRYYLCVTDKWQSDISVIDLL